MRRDVSSPALAPERREREQTAGAFVEQEIRPIAPALA